MKHLFLIAGGALLAYALIKQQSATNNTSVSNGSQTTFNAGVANTSGGGSPGAASNIGAVTGPSGGAIAVQGPDSASPDGFARSDQVRLGAGFHPLDF